MADAALVVDLRDRRAVQVDPSTGIIRAEGGALWEDVDSAAWQHGLAVVGGTFADTGVGGLTLGGGLGWLIGVQGLTCDRLVRAEVITAGGEKVIAGPDGDPDLLWALRGGGGNFGVVASFEFQGADPGPLIAGALHYPASAAKQVLRRLAEVSESAPDGLELMPWIGHPGGDGAAAPVIELGLCWAGDPATADDILRPLRAGLPLIADDLRRMTYPEVQAMNGKLAFGLRHYWKGHLLRSLDEAVISGVVDSLASHPPGRGGILLESIRGAAHREPEGGAAFGQRAATWNASAMAVWDDPAEDEVQIAWAREAAASLAVGSLTGAGYANYAPVDETIERVRLAFGTERFTRLAGVKQRYDPGNRFRFNLNIAPG
jgi:FAD/FMN-containing dehydrogenase